LSFTNNTTIKRDKEIVMKKIFLILGLGLFSIAFTACDDDDSNNANNTNNTNEGCGNGIVDGTEICDLGELNSDAVDGVCRTDCIYQNCGDGIGDSGEECDDGTSNSNTVSNSCRYVSNPEYDASSTTYTPVNICLDYYCGDGVADDGEQCDHGTLSASKLQPLPEDATGTCTPDCFISICDDGIINTSSINGGALTFEECDEGNGNTDAPNAICRMDCTLSFCGDGIEDDAAPRFEECDDGDFNGDLPNVCRTDCSDPACGDGIVDTMTEDCDTGNATSDGCIDCHMQVGWSCWGSPSVCTAGCGDGTIVGSEVCDDGDIISGDGCNGYCQLELGWNCPVVGQPCTENCGDGMIVGVETCDDGLPAADGDGCSALCLIEAGWDCSMLGMPCTENCNDGIVVGAETCDEGSTTSTAGCNAFCQVVAGWECSANPAGPCTEL
jgi:cysteine-rich repeat protein